jgi:hypothetical protein
MGAVAFKFPGYDLAGADVLDLVMFACENCGKVHFFLTFGLSNGLSGIPYLDAAANPQIANYTCISHDKRLHCAYKDSREGVRILSHGPAGTAGRFYFRRFSNARLVG